MNTRYDVGVEMRSGDWQYGNILGDYSLNKVMDIYSIIKDKSITRNVRDLLSS